MNFTKFNEIKNQLQKVYNFKAKEEREILYACKLKKDPIGLLNNFAPQLKLKTKFSNIFSTRQSVKLESDENILGNELISITKSKNNYFLEILYVNGDNIAFPYASNLNMMILLNAKMEENNLSTDNTSNSQYIKNSYDNTSLRNRAKTEIVIKKESEKLPDTVLSGLNVLNNSDSNFISIKFSDRNLELEFINSINLREFLWCLIKLIDRLKSNNSIHTKGFNHKDLEDYAEKNKFFTFNKIFDIEMKKEKYEIVITDEELETLKHTLNSIDIYSVIDYDLENLNTKIEQFNINTKEDFLQSLQGSFGQGVAEIKEGHKNLESKLKEISSNLIIDSEMIEQVWTSIQKIEEANHRIELRWENKRKLEEYMKNLLDQLLIDNAKEQSLLRCKYISNSDLIIVSEILDKFLKFFKSRKKQDVKLAILSEGRHKIKKLVDSMIINFFRSVGDFIRSHFFTETFILSELPVFSSNKINIIISKNIEKNRTKRISLFNYLDDRKFFIQKINQLFTKSDMAVDDITFNEKKYFEDVILMLSSSLGDLMNNEIAIWQDTWNTITVSEMNIEMMDINLSSDNLLNYDAFEYFNKDLIYETGKYMATVVLNSFLAVDNCAETLLSFFNEKPNFYLDRNSTFYQNAENEITKSILEIISNYFDEYMERCNILLPLIYYDILASIQDKISKNLMEDVIYITLDDVIDAKNVNEENNNNYNNNPGFLQSESNVTRKFNFGVEEEAIGNKISLQITKTFIKSNLKSMSGYLLSYFNKQKLTIETFVCKPRRIGIIPVIKKGCNMLKLIISLTYHIKQDYIYTQTEDFISKMKICIEKISKIEPKYTNIILLENYYYLYKFLKSFESFNIINYKITELEKYCLTIYEKFKNVYIEEIFVYQFKDFWDFYSKLLFEYDQQGDKIKTQATFLFNNFNKKCITFLKDLPKNIERMADRVHKHFCKEENLSPSLFVDLQNFLQNILKNINNFYDNCYKSPLAQDLYKNAIDSVNKFQFLKLK